MLFLKSIHYLDLTSDLSRLDKIPVMQYLNNHLEVQKFKMEGLEQVAKMLLPDNYMFTVDLTDGYYHLQMSNQAI